MRLSSILQDGINRLNDYTEHESEDKGQVTVPTLILYSEHLQKRYDVEKIWAEIVAPEKLKQVRVGDDDTGHFLPLEAAEDAARVINDWIKTLQL